MRTFFPLASGYTGLQPLLTEVIPESVIVCWGNFKRVSVITIPFSSNMISGFLFRHAPYFCKRQINPYFCEYRIPIEKDSNKYHRQRMRKPRIVYSTSDIAAINPLLWELKNLLQLAENRMLFLAICPLRFPSFRIGRKELSKFCRHPCGIQSCVWYKG